MNMIEKLATAHTAPASRFSIAEVIEAKSVANKYMYFFARYRLTAIKLPHNIYQLSVLRSVFRLVCVRKPKNSPD